MSSSTDVKEYKLEQQADVPSPVFASIARDKKYPRCVVRIATPWRGRFREGAK